MRIDNRALLPFATPFGVLAVIRLLFALSGAEWSEPAAAVFVSVFIGGAAGVISMIFMFSEEKSMGGFTIGKGTDT